MKKIQIKIIDNVSNGEVSKLKIEKSHIVIFYPKKWFRILHTICVMALDYEVDDFAWKVENDCTVPYEFSIFYVLKH